MNAYFDRFPVSIKFHISSNTRSQSATIISFFPPFYAHTLIFFRKCLSFVPIQSGWFFFLVVFIFQPIFFSFSQCRYLFFDFEANIFLVSLYVRPLYQCIYIYKVITFTQCTRSVFKDRNCFCSLPSSMENKTEQKQREKNKNQLTKL